MNNISNLEAKRESIGAGTVVTLKTGGPSMVVETRTADKAYCNWHNDSGDLLRDWVALVCLQVK